jgi:hypothetical protein
VSVPMTEVDDRAADTDPAPVAVARMESPRFTVAVAQLGPAPWVLLVSSAGVLLVAQAYAGGRSGAGWAQAAYWAAQVLVFAPVLLRLVSRATSVVEAYTLVIGLAVNQYLLKWLYSPEQLRFPDELQH